MSIRIIPVYETRLHCRNIVIISGNFKIQRIRIKTIKDISALNTEPVIFVVERDEVRRLLGMYLAAVGLDARTYRNCGEFLARRDSCRTRCLVLDIPFTGIEGLIIRQGKTMDGGLSGENQALFQLIPVKNQQSCESYLFTRRPSNAEMVNSADGTFLHVRELKQ